MTNVIQLGKKSEPNKLRCTSCGVTVDAPCDCGVPYALLKPSAAAKIGIEQTPTLSNRAIADRMDISHLTVKRARDEQLLQNVTVGESETRIGLDGIERKMPEARFLPNGKIAVSAEWVAEARKRQKEQEERDSKFKFIPPSKDTLAVMGLISELKSCLPALERLDGVDDCDIKEVKILLQKALDALTFDTERRSG